MAGSAHIRTQDNIRGTGWIDRVGEEQEKAAGLKSWGSDGRHKHRQVYELDYCEEDEAGPKQISVRSMLRNYGLQKCVVLMASAPLVLVCDHCLAQQVSEHSSEAQSKSAPTYCCDTPTPRTVQCA